MATPPHISLDLAVELLTSTMRDPMKSTACAMRLSLAADRIDQALEACSSMSAKIKIAKSYPELLRAGIKFLTFKQSPPDHEAMMDHLIKCRCDFGQTGMRRLHKPNRYRIDGRHTISSATLIFDAVATVSNCLILALGDLTQHKFHTGKKNTGEQHWPQGPEDLLPYGGEDSLVGLELWVAGAPLGYIVFKLVGSLALFYVPFAQEVFRSPNFTFPLIRPIQHLELAIKFYDEDDSSPLARTHFFSYPVKAIFEFFDNLVHCDTPQFNMMIIVRGSWISSILARLTTILSALPLEWSNTRTLMQHLTHLANAKIDPLTGVATMVIHRENLTELQHFDGLKNAFNDMVNARKMGCLNISCLSEVEAIHSRLCSKCNLFRFCGEKCQKEAWKSAKLPHKLVCKKIHSLKESLGAEWSLLWTPDFTYAQFQVMCQEKTVDTATVKAIGSTISALTKSKNMFLDDLKRAGASQIDRLIMEEQKKSLLQSSKDLADNLGHTSVKIVKREDAVSTTYRDAYWR